MDTASVHIVNDRQQITAKSAFRVCGVACRTSPNSRSQEIGALWQRYFRVNVREQVTARLHDAIFSVYCEYETDHTGDYTVLLGHEVPESAETPKGLVVKEIPAATYRVIEARGEQPAALIAAWQRVWLSELPRTFESDFDLHQSSDTILLHVGIRDAGPAS